MSYIKTKLSKEDKIILKEIYDELEEINLPKSFRLKGVGDYHSIKTGTNNQEKARQTCFGITKYKGLQTKSKYTKLYPYMMTLFKKFIKSHYPSFKFKSIYVNKNTESKTHLDSKNTGKSLLVGFGDYTGGKTIIYNEYYEMPKKFHIKTHSLIFNGSELPHKSEPFKGKRYSLVFF